MIKDSFLFTIQQEIDDQFEAINTKSYFYMKKTIRKVLRGVKTNIRYAKNKETEVALLLYFCEKLKAVRPSIQYNLLLRNLYQTRIVVHRKKNQCFARRFTVRFQNRIGRTASSLESIGLKYFLFQNK